MSNITSNDAPTVVTVFMVERGWRVYRCVTCGKTFFTKLSHKNASSVCGWGRCDTKEYRFRSLPKKRRIVTPTEVNTSLCSHFSASGYETVAPRNVAKPGGQTDLVVAGVQMYDDVIHGNQPIWEGKVFVAQPCIRMQFQASVGSQEGTSTSFVNVCTEQMVVSLGEHLNMVDHWCTVLSKIGLHMNDFVIIMRETNKNWGTGDFPALELFFSYGGLELGDAVLLEIPQKSRASIPISDIGFGLERIVWAINKTDSYFDTLVPWTVEGTKEMVDSCRTLALLVLCGVRATNKGPGLQCRRFSKVLGEKYYGGDVYYALSYYFDYWAQFIKPLICKDAAVRLAQLEIERFVNLRIHKVVQGLPPPRDETTEAYISRLVYTCGANIHELRKAIQICRM